jgi:hypothetical protein
MHDVIGRLGLQAGRNLLSFSVPSRVAEHDAIALL